MGKSPQKSAIQLLDEGLTQFGLGRVVEAIGCWRRVLEIDPEHAKAQEYLRAAEERMSREGISIPPATEAHEDPGEQTAPAVAQEPEGAPDPVPEEVAPVAFPDLEAPHGEAAEDEAPAVAQEPEGAPDPVPEEVAPFAFPDLEAPHGEVAEEEAPTVSPRSEGDRGEGAAEEAPAAPPKPAGTGDELMEEGRRLLREEDPEAALDLFLTVARADPERLDVESYIDMARGRLLKRYRQRFADGEAVPFLRIAPQQVMKYNLPATAGFVLSLVDSTTSVDDLIALSGMDPFEALRILHQLFEAEILGVNA